MWWLPRMTLVIACVLPIQVSSVDETSPATVERKPCLKVMISAWSSLGFFVELWNKPPFLFWWSWSLNFQETNQIIKTRFVWITSRPLNKTVHVKWKEHLLDSEYPAHESHGREKYFQVKNKPSMCATLSKYCFTVMFETILSVPCSTVLWHYG